MLHLRFIFIEQFGISIADGPALAKFATFPPLASNDNLILDYFTIPCPFKSDSDVIRFLLYSTCLRWR